MSNSGNRIPSLLAVDGSHFCFTSSEKKLTSPEKIEGSVDGANLDVLFEFEPTGGAGSDGGLYFANQSSYCDLYAKTKDGKPISGLSISYKQSSSDDEVGAARMILYDKNGKITHSGWDGCYNVQSPNAQKGYTQLTSWWRNDDGTVSQIIPYLTTGMNAYPILSDNGEAYKENYGEGNRYIWAYKMNTSEDKFTILAPDESKVADVLIQYQGTDYYSTSATDFDYDYKVKNLAEGWDVSVDMSGTSSYPNSLATKKGIPCYPALLVSITAERKTDDGLTPKTYEFDGNQDMTFQFKNVNGIKSVKHICFNCSESAQTLGDTSLNWFQYDTDDIKFDLEKGEFTLPKEEISQLVYEEYPGIGNTYQGSLTYIAEDGKEKTAYGEWYIKVKKPSVKVKKIQISSPSRTIVTGKTITLKAKITPSYVANKAVAWKSSNKKYATVDKNGKVTAKKAGKGKTVKITAKAKDGSGKSASVTIKIQ